MNYNLLRASAIMFITGVFLEGLAMFFEGMSISPPIGLSKPYIVPSLRLQALGSIYILSGMIEVFLSLYLYIKLLRIKVLNRLLSIKGKELVIVFDTVLILLFLDGIEEVFKLNITGSIGLLVAGAIFTLFLHPSLMRSAGLESDEVLKQSLILSGSLFLAFGGFSSNSVIALVHVGLISIPVFIYSFRSLIDLVRLTPMTRELEFFSSLVLEVFLALAVLAGGCVNISEISLASLNLISAFSAGLYLASGVLGIVAGVLLLFSLLTIYVHGPLLRFERGASYNPPMQI